MAIEISKKQGIAISIIIIIAVGSLTLLIPHSTGMEDVRVAVYNDVANAPLYFT